MYKLFCGFHVCVLTLRKIILWAPCLLVETTEFIWAAAWQLVRMMYACNAPISNFFFSTVNVRKTPEKDEFPETGKIRKYLLFTLLNIIQVFIYLYTTLDLLYLIYYVERRIKFSLCNFFSFSNWFYFWKF